MLPAFPPPVFCQELVDLATPIVMAHTKDLWKSCLSYEELQEFHAWMQTPLWEKIRSLSGENMKSAMQLFQDPKIQEQIHQIVSKYTDLTF